jgi:hypothetical protein
VFDWFTRSLRDISLCQEDQASLLAVPGTAAKDSVLVPSVVACCQLGTPCQH